MRSWLFLAPCAAIAVALGTGCGGGFTGNTSSSSSTSGASSASGSSSSGAGTGGAGTGGAGTGGSTATTSTTSTTTSTASTSGTGGAAPCPDEVGAYAVTEVGLGCGDLDLSASECIKATGVACQVTLVSKAGVQGQGVDGTVDLDLSGNFTGGMVKLGTVQRSGCTGTWSPATSALAVNCGGANPTSQMCTATLTRTGNACAF